MPAAVLLPTGLVGFAAERLLLAVADRLDAAGADASLGQRTLHGTGSAVAQCQVVLRGSALVAVSIDREVDVGMLLEEIDIRLQRTSLVSANIGLVVIEVDVLHALREQLLLAWSGCGWWWWRRCGHGHPGCSLLRTAGSFRSQCVGGRIGRGYLLRAAGLHGSNAVDANIGGIRGLPAQRGRLPLFDGVGASGE